MCAVESRVSSASACDCLLYAFTAASAVTVTCVAVGNQREDFVPAPATVTVSEQVISK